VTNGHGQAALENGYVTTTGLQSCGQPSWPQKKIPKQKTRLMAGSIEHADNARNYPAAVGEFGRRAREVMPAAIRALVRTNT